ncbi:MAG: acyl carrier protein [Paraglaciecola sp.]|jgi:acyl carrier protein
MTVKTTITEIFLQENRNITLEDDDDYQAMFKEVGIDSLDLVMATLKIGEHYALEFNDEDLEEIETVNELVSFIERKTAQ